jgi:hypothetical protein
MRFANNETIYAIVERMWSKQREGEREVIVILNLSVRVRRH